MFADFDAISVGDSRSLSKLITEADVRRFVELTGDDNPLHVDRAFAQATSFKDIVVHGMLGASFISTVIGTQLPGHGALWISQNFEFLLPVRLGDELTISCTVLKKQERDRLLELDTRIVNQAGRVVLTGVGKVKVLHERPQVEQATVARRRVVIVTGGAGGIGRSICERLARDGCDLVISYVSRREEAERLATSLSSDITRTIAVRADLSSERGAAELHRAALAAFGAVNVIVNNASPRINGKPLAATHWSDIEAHLDVQLRSSFQLIQACAPAMIAAGWGRIVNMTSQVIEGAPTVGWTGYAMAKSALVTLSRYLAAELGPSGVTVNCIAPGMTETGLIGDIPEKAQLIVARQTPLRRLAQPGDIASTVGYLVSDEAGFITGQTLRVNGGMVMA